MDEEEEKKGNRVKKLVKLAEAIYDQQNADEKRSGDLLTDAMKNWQENDRVTNGCAYLCGFYTAEAALDLGKKIDGAIYGVGYKRTERQMKATLARLRSRRGQPEDEPIRVRGAGC
jgi:hypothetical protein